MDHSYPWRLRQQPIWLKSRERMLQSLVWKLKRGRLPESKNDITTSADVPKYKNHLFLNSVPIKIQSYSDDSYAILSIQSIYNCLQTVRKTWIFSLSFQNILKLCLLANEVKLRKLKYSVSFYTYIHISMEHGLFESSIAFW